MNNPIEVIYTANAGVLIISGNSKVLIDGLCKYSNPIYSDTPQALADKIIHTDPPFDAIDAILYTHTHPDHFSAEMTHAYMENHPESVLIGGQTVREKLELHAQGRVDFDTDRYAFAKGANPKPILLKNMTVHPVKTVHINDATEAYEHYAFLIEMENLACLITGDAEPTMQNFQAVDFHKVAVDLVIAPFPYISTFRGQKVVRDLIKPKQIAAVHFPDAENDVNDWRGAASRMYERTKNRFVPTVFIQMLGYRYKLFL